jgi:hypothetical protein
MGWNVAGLVGTLLCVAVAVTALLAGAVEIDVSPLNLARIGLCVVVAAAIVLRATRRASGASGV